MTPDPTALAAEARERAEALRDGWLGMAKNPYAAASFERCATAITTLTADLAASRAEVERLRAGWFRMMQFDSECAPETHFGKRCEGKDTCRCAEEMDEWMAPAKFPIPDPAP